MESDNTRRTFTIHNVCDAVERAEALPALTTCVVDGTSGLTIDLPAQALADLTGPGDKTEAAAHWAAHPAISDQLDEISTDALRKALIETYGWSREEVDGMTLRHVYLLTVWVAAGSPLESEGGRRR